MRVSTVIRSPGSRRSRSAKGAPWVVRWPLMTALPGWPGRAVPGMWPGPWARSSCPTPSTITQSIEAAGMRIRPRASPSAGGVSAMMGGTGGLQVGPGDVLPGGGGHRNGGGGGADGGVFLEGLGRVGSCFQIPLELCAELSLALGGLPCRRSRESRPHSPPGPGRGRSGGYRPRAGESASCRALGRRTGVAVRGSGRDSGRSPGRGAAPWPDRRVGGASEGAWARDRLPGSVRNIG